MEKIERSPVAEDAQTRKIVTAALLAALCCAATSVLKVPSPTGGYMNLGDTMVLLGAFLLGPWYGAAGAGIGSMLADVLGGYPLYAPATLVIKAVMAVTAGLLYRALRKRSLGMIIAAVIGELPMIVGYWLYDAWLLRSFAGSAVGIPSNLVQAAFGIAASVLLAAALHKSGYVRKQFSNF